MKCLSLLLFTLPFSIFAANSPTISVASNIVNKSIFVSTQTGENGEAQLITFNLETHKAKTISLPEELAEVEIIALRQFENTLFAMGQWMKGDGKPPVVFSYDLDKKAWKSAGSLDCISFSKLTFEKNLLTVNCEEINPKGAGYIYTKKSLKLKTQIKEKVELELPQSESTSDTFKYLLKGTPTQWNGIQILTKKQNKWVESLSLSVSDLHGRIAK